MRRTTWIRQIKQGGKKLVRSEDQGPSPSVWEVISEPLQELLKEASGYAGQTQVFLAFPTALGEVWGWGHKIRAPEAFVN